MKRSIKMLLGASIAATALFGVNVGQSEAASITFKDVTSSHKSYQEIDYLAQGKITQGDGKGYFKPDNKITRAEFTMMLGRALDLEGAPSATSFKDVTKLGTTGSGYINTATKLGIINGYKGGYFKPKQTITRSEMASIIARAFKFDSTNTASGAAQALLKRGIDSYQKDGTFDGDRAGTREEMAIFLSRAINSDLRLPSATIPVTFTGTKYVNVASGDPLNLRNGPLTDYRSIGTLQRGTVVSVGYTVGKWSYVQTKTGQKGFVSTAYLSNSLSSAPTTGAGDKSLADIKLVIDPGHGGSDPGSIGDGIYEKDITLGIVLKMKALLDKTPLQVRYTRTDDSYPENIDRAKMANAFGADAFISVHANSLRGVPDANGTETWYWDPNAPLRYKGTTSIHGGNQADKERSKESKKLASSIQDRVVDVIDTRDRGPKPDQELIVVNSTNMTAVLVETAFITNPSDVAILKSESGQQKIAKAVYWGILDYYKDKGYDVAAYYNV
ncbi:N-acetylmuramoyl-L-alanine amidase [Bacillus sp. 1P06AnD]|uniref:N-acetylmuramoyl-L-alanine amidase n=1 Tax=Bacillus sp. 1P06AnD TaxID=3132208 RepID=UPI0039A23934